MVDDGSAEGDTPDGFSLMVSMLCRAAGGCGEDQEFPRPSLHSRHYGCIPCCEHNVRE